MLDSSWKASPIHGDKSQSERDGVLRSKFLFLFRYPVFVKMVLTEFVFLQTSVVEELTS